MSSEEGSEQTEPQLSIRLPEELVGGVWANYAQVSHSPFEFTIDFARLDFSQGSDTEIPGVVVARVNLSPLFVAQLLEAIQGNWQKYAARAMPREVHDDGATD